MEEKWININDELPQENEEDAHSYRLWVSTERYGEFEGFYYEGKFLSDYAHEILNVTHWMSLPRRTEN